MSNEDHKIEKSVSGIQKAMIEANAIRKASYMLLFMNIVAATMGLLIVFRNETYSYHFIILYGVGAYVFGRLGTLIVVMLQRKPHNNGIWKAVQLNNLAVVMIMMYTFQTALLYSFEGSSNVRGRFNAITGVLIFIFNLIIVIWLLRYSRKLKIKSES